jgi:hypothetical protein
LDFKLPVDNTETSFCPSTIATRKRNTGHTLSSDSIFLNYPILRPILTSIDQPFHHTISPARYEQVAEDSDIERIPEFSRFDLQLAITFAEGKWLSNKKHAGARSSWLTSSQSGSRR